MRKRLMTACTVLLVLSISWSAGVDTVNAQSDVWTSHGPDGGSVTALTIDPQTPTTLYAGTTGGGFLKSTDGGETWSAVTGLPGRFADAVVIDPQTPTTVYAGTDAGLFKSTDGGSSWSALRNDLSPRAIDPQTPTTLYGRSPVGLFKSTDGGNSWNAINTGLRFGSGAVILVRQLVVDPLSPTTLYAATRSVVANFFGIPIGIGLPTATAGPQSPSLRLRRH